MPTVKLSRLGTRFSLCMVSGEQALAISFALSSVFSHCQHWSTEGSQRKVEEHKWVSFYSRLRYVFIIQLLNCIGIITGYCIGRAFLKPPSLTETYFIWGSNAGSNFTCESTEASGRRLSPAMCTILIVLRVNWTSGGLGTSLLDYTATYIGPKLL